MIDVDMRIQQW